MANPCRICGEPAHSRGLCHTHAERWRRWGKPDVDRWVEAFLAGRLNTCVACGRPFNGYLGRSTCGPECDRRRRAEIALARFHASTPEHRREAKDAALARRRAKRAARLSPKVCPHCHGPFLPKSIKGVCPRPECGRLRAMLASRKSHHAERQAVVLRTIQERLNEPD